MPLTHPLPQPDVRAPRHCCNPFLRSPGLPFTCPPRPAQRLSVPRFDHAASRLNRCVSPTAPRITALTGPGGPACLVLPTPLPASFLPTSRLRLSDPAMWDFFISRLSLTWEFQKQCSLCSEHCFTPSPTRSSCLSLNVTLSWQPLLLSLAAVPLPSMPLRLSRCSRSVGITCVCSSRWKQCLAQGQNRVEPHRCLLIE